MYDLTSQQKKRATRLAKLSTIDALTTEDSIILASELTAIDEKLDALEEKVVPKREDGYVLTEIDKNEIASKIKVPVVEKVIERIIHEQPIVKEKETIKETIREPQITNKELSGEQIVDKINELPLDDELLKIDASHIKNLPKSEQLSRPFTSSLHGLSDVSVAGITSGQILRWNGTYWEAFTLGSSYQSPTGTVDGSNTTFTFTTAPNVLLVDGVIIRKVTSSGTVNWVAVGNSVTLTTPPFWDICAIA